MKALEKKFQNDMDFLRYTIKELEILNSKYLELYELARTKLNPDNYIFIFRISTKN